MRGGKEEGEVGEDGVGFEIGRLGYVDLFHWFIRENSFAPPFFPSIKLSSFPFSIFEFLNLSTGENSCNL